MAKWADYCISAVRYNEDDDFIAKVKVHEDKGDTLGTSEIWSRKKVITEIEDDQSFMTVLKNDGKWKKGQNVHIITVDKVKYLRTDSNSKKSDNLENLPEF